MPEKSVSPLTSEQEAALARWEAVHGGGDDTTNPNLRDTAERMRESRVCTPGDLARFDQYKKK